jgi:hypothetical protein
MMMNNDKKIKELEKARLYSKKHIPVDVGCLVVASLGFWIISKFFSVPIWLIAIVLGISVVTLLGNIINYIFCGKKLKALQ